MTSFLEINLFQEEDVIQDRFVVHLKPYRDIRELLAKGVISGNIEDIAAAVTVRISALNLNLKHDFFLTNIIKFHQT